jgi:hypothetical protein
VESVAKSWWCRLGFHKDVRMSAVDGDGYFARCKRCGRDRNIPEARFGG